MWSLLPAVCSNRMQHQVSLALFDIFKSDTLAQRKRLHARKVEPARSGKPCSHIHKSGRFTHVLQVGFNESRQILCTHENSETQISCLCSSRIPFLESLLLASDIGLCMLLPQ